MAKEEQYARVVVSLNRACTGSQLPLYIPSVSLEAGRRSYAARTSGRLAG
jgi:hypothetical protein